MSKRTMWEMSDAEVGDELRMRQPINRTLFRGEAEQILAKLRSEMERDARAYSRRVARATARKVDA